MQTITKRPILAVAGRSGGHLIPCLTLAHQYAQEQNDAPIVLVTTNSKLDAQIAQQASVSKIMYCNLDNVPYKKPWLLPWFMLQLTAHFCNIVLWCIRHRPTIVISTGGYIALPVVCAAFVSRSTSELWELNIEPGKAVKLLQYLATRTITCFPETSNYLAVTTEQRPYPVRYTHIDCYSKEQARTQLGLDPVIPVILIIGGSQGSQHLNKISSQACAGYTCQIVHQTGATDFELIQQYYAQRKANALVIAFHQQMNLLYCAADLVITRAGAGSLAELLFFKRPALIVPLITQLTDHQVANAQSYVKSHPELFQIVDEASFSTRAVHDFVAKTMATHQHGLRQPVHQSMH